MAASPYHQQPINECRNEIRLIKLIGPSDIDTIRCSIHHVSLDEPGAYDCISYTWGDSSKTRSIIIDGKQFEVTENLETALRYIHRYQHSNSQSERCIWIDAISIDQKNDAERTQQVQKMHIIFSQAEKVLIWLGREGRYTNRAFQKIRHFHLDLHLHDVLPIAWPYPEEGTRAFYDLQAFGTKLALFGHSAIDGFDDLFARPWWRRVWVIQEVAAAKTAVVLCGPHDIPFDLIHSFVSFIEWVCNFHKNANTFAYIDVARRIYYSALGICRHRNNVKSSNMNLLRSIHNIYVKKEAQASDPRDRYFAILGLANVSGLGIVADYSKSCSVIYREVAEKLIRSDELLILSYCSGVRESASIDVPTWVPDLTDRLLYPLGLDRRFQGLYSASGSTRQPKREAMCNSDPNILQLSAILVDEISAVGKSAHKPSGWTIQDLGNWIEELQTLTEEALPGTKHEERDDIVWRTVIADNLSTPNGTRRRALKSDKQEYDWADVQFQVRKKALRAEYFWNGSYGGEVEAIAEGRRGFRTKSGLVGIGKNTCQPGDGVYIILGHSTPFIAREQQAGQCLLIGEAYVHGVMDGEIMDKALEVRTLTIH